MPRINFITNNEIVDFETPQNFTHKEQEFFFELPKELQEWILTFEDNKHILIFILLYGHFKCRNTFYNLKSFSKNDIEFVLKKHKLKIKDEILTLHVRTLLRYKDVIKKYLKINKYTDEIKATLQKEQITLPTTSFIVKKYFIHS